MLSEMSVESINNKGYGCRVVKKQVSINISIVTYFIDSDIFPLLESFLNAVKKTPYLKYKVSIIENGNKEKTNIHMQVEKKISICYDKYYWREFRVWSST